MKNILFTILLALISFSVSAQLQEFTLSDGTSIGLSVSNIWKVVPTTSAGTSCKVHVLGTSSPYSVTDDYDDVVAASGGLLVSYSVISGNTTSNMALNPSAIAKAFQVGSNSKVVLTNGKVFDIDATFASLFGAQGSAVTEITSFDTIGYVIPRGAKALQIVCVGAGGGGGSGRRGAAGGARCGGSGGGGGAYSEVVIQVSDLTLDTLILMVGRGGPGGAAVSANTTDGNAGTAGVETKVLHGASVIVKASGGSAGAAGTGSAATGGAGGTTGDYAGSAGGASATAGAGIAGTSATTKTTGGGGGGGSVTAADGGAAGGAGGAGFYGLQSGGATDVNATALSVGRYVGGGGGGGTSTASSAGGAGKDGVAGGGGGGGAGSLNGNLSGAGGSGGNGLIRIIPIF